MRERERGATSMWWSFSEVGSQECVEFQYASICFDMLYAMLYMLRSATDDEATCLVCVEWVCYNIHGSREISIQLIIIPRLLRTIGDRDWSEHQSIHCCCCWKTNTSTNRSLQSLWIDLSTATTNSFARTIGFNALSIYLRCGAAASRERPATQTGYSRFYDSVNVCLYHVYVRIPRRTQ